MPDDIKPTYWQPTVDTPPDDRELSTEWRLLGKRRLDIILDILDDRPAMSKFFGMVRESVHDDNSYSATFTKSDVFGRNHISVTLKLTATFDQSSSYVGRQYSPRKCVHPYLELKKEPDGTCAYCGKEFNHKQKRDGVWIHAVCGMKYNRESVMKRIAAKECWHGNTFPCSRCRQYIKNHEDEK